MGHAAAAGAGVQPRGGCLALAWVALHAWSEGLAGQWGWTGQVGATPVCAATLQHKLPAATLVPTFFLFLTHPVHRLLFCLLLYCLPPGHHHGLPRRGAEPQHGRRALGLLQSGNHNVIISGWLVIPS